MRRLSNSIGFDDAPFSRDHRGRVGLVGAVFADLRFDGVVVGAIEKDGDDAADSIAGLVESSRFREHIRLVLLQGVTLAGFNVVDAHSLSERLALPVLIVARRQPDLGAIREVLLTRIRGGGEKWKLIEKLGAMEPLQGVYVQRLGLSLEEAAAVVERTAVHGAIPEPLRVAHLVAGALATGASRGRV